MDSIVLNVSVTDARIWDLTSNSVIALMECTVAQRVPIRLRRLAELQDLVQFSILTEGGLNHNPFF